MKSEIKKELMEDANLWSGFKKTDEEIAEAALNAIEWHTTIPRGTVMVSVKDGWITLTGEVGWEFQKTSAKNEIEDLQGVKGVTNDIKVAILNP